MNTRLCSPILPYILLLLSFGMLLSLLIARLLRLRKGHDAVSDERYSAFLFAGLTVLAILSISLFWIYALLLTRPC